MGQNQLDQFHSSRATDQRKNTNPSISFQISNNRTPQTKNDAHFTNGFTLRIVSSATKLFLSNRLLLDIYFQLFTVTPPSSPPSETHLWLPRCGTSAAPKLVKFHLSQVSFYNVRQIRCEFKSLKVPWLQQCCLHQLHGERPFVIA